MASLRTIVPALEQADNTQAPTSPPKHKEFFPAHLKSKHSNKKTTKEKIDKLVNEGAKNYPAYLKLIYTGESDFSSDNVSSEDEGGLVDRKWQKKRSNEASRCRMHRKSHSVGRMETVRTKEEQGHHALDSNKISEARLGKENSADGLCNVELGGESVAPKDPHTGNCLHTPWCACY